jgi:hypothetical protein
MNNIPAAQNTDRQIQRLSAQRHLYAAAKTVFGWQVFLGGPVAVIFAFIVIVFPQIKGCAALWGILVSLCDLFWLTPWQKRLREKAARVQELFDCDVLSLPWNDLKAGSRPDPELIKEQSEKYQRWSTRMPTLRNWYGKDVGQLPLHVARIACQRTNCWWDSKQRRRYAVCVITLVLAVFATVSYLTFVRGFTIEDFVLKVAAPLAPALLLGVRQFNEQMDAARRLDKLKEHSERLWAEALSGTPEIEMTARARELQDEILENRKRGPLVFDVVYKLLQKRYEVQMNHGFAELVEEAKQRLGLP